MLDMVEIAAGSWQWQNLGFMTCSPLFTQTCTADSIIVLLGYISMACTGKRPLLRADILYMTVAYTLGVQVVDLSEKI